MTLDDFLLNSPLYAKVSEEDGASDIIYSLYGINRYKTCINGYNPIDKCDTTFFLYYGLGSIKSSNKNINDITYHSNIISHYDTNEVIFICSRYETLFHFLIHIEVYDSKKIISKVGQYPSVADFHIGQVHKYDKVLSKDKMREFTKAIGLAANGIGIGSFVYLRRIFEHLVSEAFEKAISENDEFDADAFSKAKMNNKIQMLSGYLPDFLVENYSIYGILSKGIHELSEEDCKSYFSILRESIEMILDEKEDNRQKEMKKDNIKKVLSQITREINN